MRSGGSPALLSLLAIVAVACGRGPTPTWNGEVAAIVHRECAGCHRPDGLAPFSALTYEAVAARADRVAERVGSGSMPPWPPEAGDVEFLNQRTLTDEEREAIVRWAEEGAPRGEGDPPPRPTFADWPLGEPDRVVVPPEPFALPAGGTDVFRNLVIPVTLDSTRYVRAVDLRPGSPGNVHHAILYVDDTGAARRAEAAAEGPGFPGMDIGEARPPEGAFVGWTPGNVPFENPPGMAWRLDPGTDFVLQLHMMPSARPREIRPEIGLYFADRPPIRTPVVVTLRGTDIDIPPGDEAYRVVDRFRVPVDVKVLSIYPHAHFLGKDLHGYGVLPDGGRRELIHIPDWDFQWQDQYVYARPVSLPAGSEIVMDYTYDNSSGNPRNPNDPPRRVRSGDRSTDEMAELIVQMVAGAESDRWALLAARSRHALEGGMGGWREVFNLALAAHQQGDARRAAGLYREALGLNPELLPAHFNLGNLFLSAGEPDSAAAHFRAATEIEPGRADLWHNLGYARELQKRPEEAAAMYETALERDPAYAPAWYALGNLRFAGGDADGAIAAYREALRIRPGFVDARVNLGNALRRKGDLERAVAAYRAALEEDPGHAYASYNLGVALEARGDTEGAIRSLKRAVRAAPRLYEARLELARVYRAAGRRAEALREYEAASRLGGEGSEARREMEALR